MLLRKCTSCNAVYGCIDSEKKSVCRHCPDDHDCKCRANLLLLGDDYMTAGICLGCQRAPKETPRRLPRAGNEAIHS